MSATPTTLEKMSEDIWKIIEDVADEYPKKEREELKAIMLDQLGRTMFYGTLNEKNT